MAAKTTMTGFVGRADELATLRASVVEGAGGRPTTVLVGGDAGVGKSRLLAELAADPGVPDALLLFGHCVDVGDGELPYAPILGALRALAAALDRDELEQVLGPGKRELARLLPDLGISEAIAPAPGEPHGQARLFELLLGALGRLSAGRPVVLVIEDLHWADRSTRDLLRFLVRSATAERLAIVASYRTDELHRRHPLRPFLAELERDQHVRRLVVAPFRREELADLVAQVSGAPPDGATLDELYERTEGNPFFAEELLAASAIASELPESLLDALLVRIERLSSRAQRVVRAAAAAGRPARRSPAARGGGRRARVRAARDLARGRRGASARRRPARGRLRVPPCAAARGGVRRPAAGRARVVAPRACEGPRGAAGPRRRRCHARGGAGLPLACRARAGARGARLYRGGRGGRAALRPRRGAAPSRARRRALGLRAGGGA